ncbi:MAG TPA: DNA-binding response regulator [Bacteroidetes bacterium]|nr:DNA-binding response regulator [Bacteroidota bacterium]
MKILLVEDEEIAARRLERLLGELSVPIEEIRFAESVSGAEKELRSGFQPELVFLDIHLEDGTGFEVIPFIPEETPIIFTTAFDNYAIEAFKVNSIGYLLKPVVPEDLASVMDKFHRLKKGIEISQLQDLQQLIKQLRPGQDMKRLLIRIGTKLKSIDLGQIALIQSVNRIIYLYTQDGNRYPVEKTLDELEKLLPDEQFFRVNRSAIINEKAIRQLIIWSKSRIKLELEFQPEEELLVSAEKVQAFKSWYTGS